MTNEEEVERKTNWRFRWLGDLFLFCHIEYQKGLWFESKYPNEIGWFSEDVCKYFDDLHLYDNYKYQLVHGLISKSEFDCIIKFHKDFDAFVEWTNENKESFDDKQIHNNDKWLKICALGALSWIQLKDVIIDPNEIEHMNKLELNYL